MWGVWVNFINKLMKKQNLNLEIAITTVNSRNLKIRYFEVFSVIEKWKNKTIFGKCLKNSFLKTQQKVRVFNGKNLIRNKNSDRKMDK